MQWPSWDLIVRHIYVSIRKYGVELSPRMAIGCFSDVLTVFFHNKMVFHPSKSHVLSITRAYFINLSVNFVYFMNETAIEYTVNEKDLVLHIITLVFFNPEQPPTNP